MSVGLSGPGNESEFHTLRELNFSKTFYDANGGTLAQSVTINLGLTKVMNIAMHSFDSFLSLK